MEPQGLVLEVRSPMAGWVWPLAKVPDPAFAGALLGPGLAIDPLAPLITAPFDGKVVTFNSTHHAIVIRHESGVEVLIHVGIDTVSLGGEGFTALVKAGQQVAAGDPLIECDLDLVAKHGLSLASPVVVVAPDGAVLRELAAEGEIVRGAVLYSVETEVGHIEGKDTSGEFAEASVEIGLPHGIHARPAAGLARLLREARHSGELAVGERRADLTSTVALMRAGFAKGEMASVRIEGAGAQDVLRQVLAILGGDFAEASAHSASESPAPAAMAEDGKLGGLPGSAGLAAGPSFRHRPPRFELEENGRGAGSERAALASALQAVEDELEHEGASGAMGQVLAAHRELAADPELRRLAEAGIEAGQSAAFAWRSASEEIAALFAQGDARLAERVADLEDLTRRVLTKLIDKAPEPIRAPAGSVVIAADLLPSDLAHYARCGVSGIALAGSSPTAHVAIIAAGLGLPMLTTVGTGINEIVEGQSLVVDADSGVLELTPTAERVAEVSHRNAERRKRNEADLAKAHQPAVTRDGASIPILANLGGLDDAIAAVNAGADGCGLLRTEFLFLNRKTAPPADEQTATYRAIRDALGERPLTIRTLDIGGDKPVPFLSAGPEDNPALGLRGLRISLAHPDLLDAQLRAALDAADGFGGPLQLMVPMVSGLHEWQALRDAVERMGGTGAIKLGLMIETPAAVLLADQFAAEADFLSIGTNDLTQYVLAMDRTNPALACHADPLHPAVLRAIRAVCTQAAPHKCPVSVCGSLGGDPIGIPLLIGLGVTSLSVVPAAVPATKRNIRTIDRSEWTKLAHHACDLRGPTEVRAFVQSQILSQGAEQ